MSTRRPDALKFLHPGWFTLPVALAGLGLAWYRAQPLMGDMAAALALLLGGAAALVLGLLLAASVLRLRRHPEAWSEDCRHPVRHAFVAALPLSLILLATLGVLLLGPLPALDALWRLGCVGQLAVTVWVFGRLWRPAADATRLAWPAVTPVLLMPSVGNVLAPLGGLALGHPEWSAAQFGLGAMFWPLIAGLLMARVLAHGMLAERLLPTLFILVAPPALLGQGLLSFGAPPLLGWAAWGMALCSLAWVLPVLGRVRGLPFSLTHWALSFPLSALAALTLRLATPGGALSVLGPLLLALSSLILLGLSVATWRGLREGSLLAPEVVMPIVTAG